MVCKRCSAECTCKKVKRKPRARRAKPRPVVMPPMPQQFFFGPTPRAQELYTSQVRSDYLPEGALPRRATAETQTAYTLDNPPPEVVAQQMVALAKSVDTRPERAEMEVQTEDIMVPMRGGQKSLREIEFEVSTGGKTLSLRPTVYERRGGASRAFEGRTMPQPMEEAFMGAAAGGGAAGGGEAPLPPRIIRRKKPAVATAQDERVAAMLAAGRGEPKKPMVAPPREPFPKEE